MLFAYKNYYGKLFVAKHRKIWERICALMSFIDTDYVDTIQQIEHRGVFGGLFSLGFLHTTSTYLTHRDNKDYEWCCLVLFGSFTGGRMYFPYLGAEVKCQPSDLLVFDSHKVYHKAQAYFGYRGSLILTNHYIIVTDHARHQANKH